MIKNIFGKLVSNSLVEATKKAMTKDDIAALEEPKDKIDAKDLKALRDGKHLRKESYEQVQRAGAGEEPRRGRGRPSKDPKKIAAKAASQELADIPNIIQQMNKAPVGDYHHITFKDGKTYKIPSSHVKRAKQIYMSLKTTEQKDNFTKKLHGNVNDFTSALADKNPGAPSTKTGVTLSGGQAIQRAMQAYRDSKKS